MSGKFKTTGTLPAPVAARSLAARLRGSLAIHPVFWIITGILLLRCLFILLSPLDLIADESYYWDWSRRLDYGYYSKPPMIAWINWVSTSLLGSHEFAVRFPAALLGLSG
uniref:CAZy families GT83 protein n=1 Tax=uncultured Maricaulis sp. TaxID=174710 RepID=A0A060CNJ4_9PROT|nr:CAZy families GT83 protein [uncultured Maricaulis sp.]